MKLVRYGKVGSEKPGMIDSDGKLRDLSKHVDDITPSSLSQISKLKKLDEKKLKLVSGKQRFGPPVGDIGKFMCIGLNYSDHAAETGAAIPEHPALKYVAGYTICNDVSERTFQKQLTGQWTKGKSCDTFGPIGPWLVTKDEIKDPQNLDLSLDLNGKRMQTGNTSLMIFTVAEIISHLSQMFTLHPGDVISTGTPPGVGAGIKPKPKFLKVGDTMELHISGLGHQKQKVKMDK